MCWRPALFFLLFVLTLHLREVHAFQKQLATRSWTTSTTNARRQLELLPTRPTTTSVTPQSLKPLAPSPPLSRHTTTTRLWQVWNGQGLPSKPGWVSDRLNRVTRWAGSKAANRPVICEYNPSGWWLWFKWRGTVLQMIYRSVLLTMGTSMALDLVVRRVSTTTWGLLSVPPASEPIVQSLGGMEKLWTYTLTICTFMLTFFLSHAYTYWQKVYNTCRIIQGRINDYCMLLTLGAEREIRPDPIVSATNTTSTVANGDLLNANGAHGANGEDTTRPNTTRFTPRSLKLVQKCTRLARMAHILFWAATPTASNGLTDSEDYLEDAEDCPIPIQDENIGPLLLSPFGLQALVHTGQLTKGEMEGLMNCGLFPSQYPFVLLEWVGLHTMEGLRSGVLTGDSGLENNLLQQLTSLRASMFDIDDFRAGRMPLAYVQLVQVLVDSLVMMAPFALYPELGSLSVLLVGIMALFFRGLMTLSKSFLDPFGVEGYVQQTIRVDTLISELNFGASKRWIQAGNLLPADRPSPSAAAMTSSANQMGTKTGFFW